MQKILCRNLILWDQIEPTKAWIENQLPHIIKFSHENDITTIEEKFEQQLGGECIDFACISLCHANITTGACLSIAFKYAGTANESAFSLIHEYANKLRKQKVAVQMNTNILHQIYSDQSKNLIDKYTQENCLVMCALAMSLVMAGTGNKECFRALRVIRKRVESGGVDQMHYGHSLAINMALGFLFLGSGAYTIGRSKFAIASLLCSLYPIFPKDPSENRFHLQALRHFWVMAIESRFIQARDVDTGEFLQVQVNMTKASGEV
jgi:anaphase-promoting complex subunit 1